MKIDSSAIKLFGQHDAVERQSTRESLKAWVGPQRPRFEGEGAASTPALGNLMDRVAVSEAARSRLAAESQASAAGSTHKGEACDELAASDCDPRLRLIRLLIERMTGQKIKLLSLHEVEASDETVSEQEVQASQQTQARPTQGWGVEYDYHESYYEAEKTTFLAEGVIRTKDGQEIGFKLDLAMSREFVVERDVSVRLGDAQKKDPLVINFEGTAAQLSSARFSFDIDADGEADNVCALGSGSGFLALDIDGDGRIDDGSELLGTRTGDGFAELAAYDDDRNGWIDQQDQVYGRLRVWSGAGQAEGGTLSTLDEKGVGAIYLNGVATPFDVKDASNSLLGNIKASSVYVTEKGTTGSVQQVDLAI